MARDGEGMRGGEGGGRCASAARVLAAVRLSLSEEISFSSSSSSLPSLSPELKAHLASCASCAAEARALDPTLLFVPLGTSFAAAPAAEDVRRVTDDVLAEVRRRSRVVAPRAPRPFYTRRLLQAAALVALAAGVFGVEGIRLARKEHAADLAPTPDERRDKADTLASDVRPPARPMIQDLKNPGARVYEFAASSPGEPNVVFIADPHADL